MRAQRRLRGMNPVLNGADTRHAALAGARTTAASACAARSEVSRTSRSSACRICGSSWAKPYPRRRSRPARRASRAHPRATSACDREEEAPSRRAANRTGSCRGVRRARARAPHSREGPCSDSKCPGRESNPQGGLAPEDFTRDPEVSLRRGLSLHPRGVSGARGRGLSLGLTPLVSAPSAETWPPAAWLRITVLHAVPARRVGFPEFTRFLTRASPRGRPCSSPLCLPVPPPGHAASIAASHRRGRAQARSRRDPSAVGTLATSRCPALVRRQAAAPRVLPPPVAGVAPTATCGGAERDVLQCLTQGGVAKW